MISLPKLDSFFLPGTPVSFQIKVADLDFHLFEIGHGSIS